MGDGNVFSVSTTGGGCTTSPSNNTSNHRSHVFSRRNPSSRWGGGGVPQSQDVSQSQAGETPVPGGGTPISAMGVTQNKDIHGQDRTGISPSQNWLGQDFGAPSQDRTEVPRDILYLDRLYFRWYASCGFPQEDCLEIKCSQRNISDTPVTMPIAQNTKGN